MRRKKIIEASVVCILLLLLGAYMEFSSRSMDDKNRIIRGSPGSGRQEVELTLNAGEQLKDYDYQISVPAQCIDEKTAQSYFSRAEKEIDETFFPEGEEAAHVTEQVHMKPSYVKGLVKADWTLDQYNAVDVDGTIREDQLDPQGELVQASVALTCEKYREEYTFSFQVYPKVMSQQEKVIHEIAAEVEQQSTQEGERYLTLPDQAAGVKLQWKEKKQHLVWKILFFEVLVLFLMAGIVLERKRTADHIKKEQMKLEDWKKDADYDRLGLEEEYIEYLGNKVVCHSLPIRPGRNLAVICETAAVNHRQKKMGYNAAQELYRRVQANMTKSNDEE